MPGVLIEGGPRGRDEERACRLRPAEGASLCGSACGPSDRIIASTIEDMVAVSLLSLFFKDRQFAVNLSWRGRSGSQNAFDAKHAPR